MKNIKIIGAGFIASHLSYELIKERLEPNTNQIKSVLEKYKPDTIINCIGFCGQPNIDQCEIEKNKTIEANTTIPIILATECEKLGIKLIHISSGCIFQGTSPHKKVIKNKKIEEIDGGWEETDFAQPPSFYSHTKYAADLVIGNLPNTTCLRIRMPISNRNNPRNFINKIINYPKIINVPNSMTFVEDLVKCIDFFIDNDKNGIYNVVNPQPLTAVQIVLEYSKYKPQHTFSVLTEKQLNKLTIAKRSNCILSADKLLKEGFVMSPSIEMLQKTMKEFINNLNNDTN